MSSTAILSATCHHHFFFLAAIHYVYVNIIYAICHTSFMMLRDVNTPFDAYYFMSARYAIHHRISFQIMFVID